MTRSVSLVGLALLVIALSGQASIPSPYHYFYITVESQKYCVHDVDGLVIGPLVKRGNDAASWGWLLSGGRIKNSLSGRYLAYDPEGKDRRVFLVDRPGAGTDWDREYRSAMRGPMKGWGLDVEEIVEKPSADGGRPRTVRRLILSQKPARQIQTGRFHGQGR